MLPLPSFPLPALPAPLLPFPALPSPQLPFPLLREPLLPFPLLCLPLFKTPQFKAALPVSMLTLKLGWDDSMMAKTSSQGTSSTTASSFVQALRSP